MLFWEYFNKIIIPHRTFPMKPNWIFLENKITLRSFILHKLSIIIVIYNLQIRKVINKCKKLREEKEGEKRGRERKRREREGKREKERFCCNSYIIYTRISWNTSNVLCELHCTNSGIYLKMAVGEQKQGYENSIYATVASTTMISTTTQGYSRHEFVMKYYCAIVKERRIYIALENDYREFVLLA